VSDELLDFTYVFFSAMSAGALLTFGGIVAGMLLGLRVTRRGDRP
jgi:hypothetical protein